MSISPPATYEQHNAWPRLPAIEAWRDTCETLHMWTQIIGKIRLELAPWINHSWGSTLYVTTRGLSTSPIPCHGRSFAIDFDFIDHALQLTVSDGTRRSVALRPMSVAEFYRQTMDLLDDANIHVDMLARPVEVAEATPFEKDHQHASYDAKAVHRYWHALVQVQRVFTAFRSRYLGKVSPVHFFWGAFDLAVTRFSGRPAPKHPGGAPNCADWVMEEAYSHELSSAGFWPGTGLGEPAFYAYAYPEPDGFRQHPVQPDGAYYHDDIGEYVLPYENVRSASDSDNTLLSFLQSTYEAAAIGARWNRSALERETSPA